MTMNPRLISVIPLADFRLLLQFDNKECRVFDVTPYLETGIFQELKNEAIFRSVRLSFDTIEWSNGADLCPEVLYAQSEIAEETDIQTAMIAAT
jgi:hypothetical protein